MVYDAKASALAREATAAHHLIAEIGSDDETLCHDMIEGETSLLEAIDAALIEMTDCEIIVEGCKSAESAISARRTKAEARKTRIRGLIEQAMMISGLDSAKRPTATLTVRKVKPKPIVTDESAIPAEYWRQPDPVLDKTKINKVTEQISGITMSNGGTSLQIRRV
jgi:hypothetical protein